MNSPNQYRDLFRSRVASAIEQARATSKLSHQGVKGSIVEILIRDLLRPLLPADIGVGSGQIIDSYAGAMSNQIDIVLYDRSILPPILYDGTTGLFPIESVLYSIEVKTRLTAADLRDAHASAKRLATEFGYRPGKETGTGEALHHPIDKLRSVVFALASDLRGSKTTEADRYRKIYADSDAHLRAICVVDREYWYDNGDFWVGTKASNFDGVLAFIGGVTNTYRRVAESRGRPGLGSYIIPAVTALKGTKSRDFVSVSLICAQCGLNGESAPKLALPHSSVTVNGSLTMTCPNCGGQMKSEDGVYKFEKGVLVGREPPPFKTIDSK